MILNLNKRLLSALIFTVILLFLYAFYHAALPANHLPPVEKSSTKSLIKSPNQGPTNPGVKVHDEEGNDWCSRVSGTRYLDDLASTWAVSCSNPGLSPTVTKYGGDGSKDGGLICFQSQIEQEPDNFCVAKNAVYTADAGSLPPTPISKEDLWPENGILPPEDVRGSEKKNTRPSRPYKRDGVSTEQQQQRYNSHTRRQSSPWGFSQKRWKLNCSASKDWSYGVQAVHNFRTYFSETGVGQQLRGFDMSIKEASDEERGCNGSIMLVKLEGGGNIWHTLMEVWSAVLTLDALKRAERAREKLFGINNEEEGAWEGENVEIYIQENMESEMNASPVFGLWNVVTGKKVQGVQELKDGCYKSVILPLAGGANPFWKDHWKERNCEKSTLVDGFVGKVLKFYGVEDSHEKGDEGKVKIRIIGRQKNRKILRLFDYVKNLKGMYLDADIEITKLEKLSVTEQLRLIRNTDVLMGVTGAGLTHTMFLRKGAAVIELTQPEPFVYFGFGNIARMIGVDYFSVQAEKREGKSGINWQEDNVLVDERTFVDVVGRAIAGVKARRERRVGWDDVN
ncbi:uncharacterized protein DFL_003882 [Arthrobotrys flagrans]|uniref:EGF domain-specific O-linked N-acetylglucosamine transferase n=1 Tax=Arthrobotrys flagrans TaxID=97331 RepID=A0A437A336_ARTFL|nr:hypothetical protein DFL_003882 [Arthrobotrys flagrans]